jgi:hypothetical protein
MPNVNFNMGYGFHGQQQQPNNQQAFNMQGGNMYNMGPFNGSINGDYSSYGMSTSSNTFLIWSGPVEDPRQPLLLDSFGFNVITDAYQQTNPHHRQLIHPLIAISAVATPAWMSNLTSNHRTWSKMVPIAPCYHPPLRCSPRPLPTMASIPSSKAKTLAPARTHYRSAKPSLAFSREHPARVRRLPLLASHHYHRRRRRSRTSRSCTGTGRANSPIRCAMNCSGWVCCPALE